MAVVDTKSVQYTAQFVTVPPSKVHASYQGKTMTMMATLETLASDAGATFYMFRPPKGARWNGVGKLFSDAQGSGVTGAVGIAGTTDKFLAAASIAAASALDLGVAGSIAGVMYEFDGATDVIITTAGAAIEADKTVTLMMQFSLA